MSQKSGTLNFRYFDIRKYRILFHQIKHCLLKRRIRRSLNLVIWVVLILWSFFRTWTFSIFSSFSWHFQSGIMAFLTSIHRCQQAHWSVQTKQNENLWTAIPAVNSSRRFNKIHKWLCLKKWLYYQCYQTKSNDLTILVSFFLEDNVWSDEYQSNENRAFRFFFLGGGHPE